MSIPPDLRLSSFTGCPESRGQEEHLLRGKAVVTHSPWQADNHRAPRPSMPRKPYLDSLHSFWLSLTYPGPSSQIGP